MYCLFENVNIQGYVKYNYNKTKNYGNILMKYRKCLKSQPI